MAASDPAGLIRAPQEVDSAYISEIITCNTKGGISLVAQNIEEIILGEIHASRYPIQALRHNLVGLTIAIHPNSQGLGIGRRLFTTFLDLVKSDYPHILRVELFTRNDNDRTLRFYKSLGFVDEGVQKNKIIDATGALRTPVHMAWFNPQFNINEPL